MGYGGYDRSAYTSYAKSVSTKSAREIFTASACPKSLDPKGIKLRESCDSEEHPKSRAIILGLDVTGSMGVIAEVIAKKGLGILMEGILDGNFIADPHLMFMAIGDVNASDSAPLQASQFESDNRIVQQLSEIFLEGGGGCNDTESYDLPWYFAANYTSIDCWNKRQQKGLLFTIGDEMPPAGVKSEGLKRIFGTDGQTKSVSAAEMLSAAREKYDVFHIIVEEGNYCKRRIESVSKAWYNILGNRAIRLKDYQHVSEVILAVIRVNEGEEPEDVILSYQDTHVQDVVRHALFANSGQ